MISMFQKIESIIKLEPTEEKKFTDFIKSKRNHLISSSQEIVKKTVASNKDEIESLLNSHKISPAIMTLRALCYDHFLAEESHFNSIILSEIGTQFNTPKSILDSLSTELFNLKKMTPEQFQKKVGIMFGKFSGAISPYIYKLCLSNTQSRRSRAGKVFESIIYFLYDYFNFPYESQAAIGKKTFSDLNLGKVVDSILPSTKAFQSFRNKTIVGSMKTTLRERWQEVVEEISRSGLPNIYLLTVDDNISFSKADQMSKHNIVLVVLHNIKQQAKLMAKRSIIDFETYFQREVPDIITYWNHHENS